MLLATPGQTTTTAYSTLHNNSNNTGSSSTTTLNPAARKQTAVNISSASANHPPPVNKQNNLSSNTTSSTLSSTSSTSLKTNNINSLKNHNSFHFQSPTIHKNVTSSNDTKTTNNQPQQHSLKTGDNSKSLSFINSLKDTVQKVFVTTATTSLARNCNQTTNIATTSSTIKTTNSTNSGSTTVNHYNTSKTSTYTSYSNNNNVTSSSSTASSSSSSAVANTILSATVARKKSSTQNLGVQPRLHTIPPTILHRCAEERQKTSSTDSLRKEMCHFKPIRTEPTTPWKSGSKSRGSSLRFPKANLATRTNEFILKSNCDVNNRKKKLSSAKIAQNERHETGDGDDGDNDNEEQENREHYEHFKPNPSTLHLFAECETPNHQSAFVCLVAHMKNLINIQTTKVGAGKATGGDMVVDGGSRNTRTLRTKDKEYPIQIKKNMDIPMTEVCLRSNRFKSPAPPMSIAKKLDPTSGKNKMQSNNNVSNKSITNNTSEFSGRVTKAKARSKQLKGAKTEIVKLVKEQMRTSATPAKDAGHPTAAVRQANTNQRNTRKRKLTPEVSSSNSTTTNSGKSSTTSSNKKDNFIVPPTPTLRSMTRSSRMAKQSMDVSAVEKSSETNCSRLGAKHRIGSFSPPLTRSRLKQIMGPEQRDPQLKLFSPTVTATNVRKRKR
ncbi:uncharacterized protein LOC101892634 [Musca domestica]|uniref:Uncharacterized protein LOC101892634 n=1 Tax=Musca domestica TaxID=7370 RepID=A0A9J7CYD2_MUSDO|nr:uncharacterized protein LOC101892634 [Musca domestica]XP_019894006.2 uncharacterized protein LOC101892634 [Musca domestica]